MKKPMVSMIVAAGLVIAATASAEHQKQDPDPCAWKTDAPKDDCVTQASARERARLAREEAAAARAKCEGMSDAENAKCVEDAKRKRSDLP